MPPDKRLPPIFPVVLSNGNKRWNAATELKDLIVNLPGGLEQYTPSLKYLILDEGKYENAELIPLKNLVAAIFRLENSSTPAETIEVVSNLIEWLATPEQAGLRRSFSIWIKRVLLATGNDNQLIPEINELVEIKTMLKDRIPEWIREGRTEGRIEGEIEGEIKGEAKTLLKLLSLKFGAVPEWIEQRVNSSDKEQLDHWVEVILTATTLDEMFS